MESLNPVPRFLTQQLKQDLWLSPQVHSIGVFSIYPSVLHCNAVILGYQVTESENAGPDSKDIQLCSSL